MRILSRLRPRRILTPLTIITVLVLVPLTALPVPAHAAALKVTTPDKLAPLASDKPVNTAVVPAGDFSNLPPDRKVDTTVGDHFDSATSKVVAQDATSDTYLNTDGTETKRIHDGEVNFQDAKGVWQKIDSTLVPDASGRLKPRSLPVDVSIATSSSDPNLATITNGTASVSFTPQASLGGRIADRAGAGGSVAKFAGIANGADVSYQSVGDGLKELITLNTPPLVTDGLHYSFNVKTTGLKAIQNGDGSISFIDANNNDVVFTVPVGSSWDANGSTSKVTYKLSADAKTVDVLPDTTWLADPARAFPVVIDPSVFDAGRQSAHYDAFACSDQPNNINDGNSQNDNNSLVDKAGYPTYSSVQCASYMKFDTSSINNTQVLSGSLKYYDETYVQGTGGGIRFYPGAQDWTTTATPDQGWYWSGSTIRSTLNNKCLAVDTSNGGANGNQAQI